MRLSLIVVLSIIGFLCFGCNSSAKFDKGKEVVAKVENFRNEKGRFPNSLDEIGIDETESGPVYYKKTDDSKYIVWFGKELGESMIYDSDTKEWK
ncbi:MAG: hypothetical protein KDB79_09655 [Acidobacteria bacterium]|nr:hypothetical protein [Acidobacteriota bacterium]